MYFYMKLTSYHRIEHTMGNVFVKITEATNTSSKRETIFVFILVLVLLILYIYYRTANNTPDLPSGRTISMADQENVVATLYGDVKSSKRAITTDSAEMVKIKFKSLVNCYALGCRYTGYIGPIEDGYFNPSSSVQMAVDSGCRVFVLDIDYIDKQCSSSTYIPRIVVRDSKGRMMIQYNSNYQLNNPIGEIRQVCEAIQTYAFSSGCQNAADPVIIVLYFLRTPPGGYKSLAVLRYYSLVAKALAPFRDRLLGNESSGGTFHRQSQENILLINPITDYSGKVLIFSNANTSGFRESTMPFESYDDLDFLVNLRLTYNQTKMGSTENNKTNSFGILQSADDYMNVPEDRKSEIITQTKAKWTICLSPNPSIPVTQATYDLITKKYGVHCVPTHLFNAEASKFLFTDDLFKKFGFRPKPCPDINNSDTCLCFIPPAKVVAGTPSKTLDSNGGNLPGSNLDSSILNNLKR